MTISSFLIPTGDTIYLDHAATTPVDPLVLGRMLPWFTQQFGNPSSLYDLGQEGRDGIDVARQQVASVLGCDQSEILFTSGATESNNLALNGVATYARKTSGINHDPHIIVSSIEHHAVLHPAERLRDLGFALTILPVDAEGFLDPDAVRSAMRAETCLISVMYANNETGVIQPIEEIGTLAREKSILFHCDAVQAAGALPLNVGKLGVDLLSLSAHKFYGPKAAGILYVRKGTPIEWQQLGGGQEDGRRGGTENVAGIVGLATALALAESQRDYFNDHCRKLRDRLFHCLLSEIPELTLNGPEDLSRRLSNNLNIAFPGIQGETLLLSLAMQGVALSAGSACTTGNSAPSHVLKAMGLSDEHCRSSLRISLGRCNTDDQVDETVALISEATVRIRSLTAVRR